MLRKFGLKMPTPAIIEVSWQGINWGKITPEYDSKEPTYHQSTFSGVLVVRVLRVCSRNQKARVIRTSPTSRHFYGVHQLSRVGSSQI